MSAKAAGVIEGETARAQLPLQFPPPPPRLTREDFIVTGSNRSALETMDAWSVSGERFLTICGAKGAGKTHLASILAAENDTSVFSADRVAAVASAPTRKSEFLIVDGMEHLAAPRSLLERIEQRGVDAQRMVLVGSGDPKDWAKGLRDLETRLAAMPRISLAQPDEALLRALITKLFRDRQLRVPEKLAEFATPRLPKTFAAALLFVAAVDEESKRTKTAIGLGLMRRVLDNLSEEALTA